MIGGLLHVVLHPLSTVWTLFALAGLVLMIWAVIDIIGKDPAIMGRTQKWIWAGVMFVLWLFSAGVVGGLIAAFYLFAYRKMLGRG
jgi:hypothetical protein